MNYDLAAVKAKIAENEMSMGRVLAATNNVSALLNRLFGEIFNQKLQGAIGCAFATKIQDNKNMLVCVMFVGRQNMDLFTIPVPNPVPVTEDLEKLIWANVQAQLDDSASPLVSACANIIKQQSQMLRQNLSRPS